MNNDISKTELQYKGYKQIDQLDLKDAIKTMIEEQALGINIINREIENLANVVNQMYNKLLIHDKSKIIYCGAGTSGRIGIQDAVELYPTFGWPVERVNFIISGGLKSLTQSIENSEDNIVDAKNQAKSINIQSRDIVIGITASGNTPFTCEVIKYAKQKKAMTISISNNPNGTINQLSNFNILLDTGEELVAGSTRLKAGTSQKTCLNIISTMLMVKFNYVRKGLMTNMIPLNKKLKRRQILINELLSN